MPTFELNGSNLNAAIVARIAAHWQDPHHFSLSVSPEAVQRVERTSRAVAEFVQRTPRHRYGQVVDDAHRCAGAAAADGRDPQGDPGSGVSGRVGIQDL